MIIGLTGTNASGKSSVADYLMGKGFRSYSLSDELRALLRSRRVAPTRKNLINAGKYYRKKYGRGFLAARVKGKIGRNNAVVDSIRNVGEVEEFGKAKGFVLIAVDAPVMIRFGRARKRMSARDQRTFKEFLEMEREELHGKGPGQQIRACMKKADFKIDTRGGYTNLYKKIDAILKRIR